VVSILLSEFKDTVTDGSIAVIFGDPFNGISVTSLHSSQLKEFCASGDYVCGTLRTFIITDEHLSYANDVSEAARFVAELIDQD
jgi:cutinase